MPECQSEIVLITSRQPRIPQPFNSRITHGVLMVCGVPSAVVWLDLRDEDLRRPSYPPAVIKKVASIKWFTFSSFGWPSMPILPRLSALPTSVMRAGGRHQVQRGLLCWKMADKKKKCEM